MPAGTAVGDAAPDFRLTKMDGSDISLADLRGHPGIKEFGIRYAVARDADASLARRYHVSGTPTVIILDRNGFVHYFGNELPADYNTRLDSLLEKRE